MLLFAVVVSLRILDDRERVAVPVRLINITTHSFAISGRERSVFVVSHALTVM